jgi:hypothetical protein
VFVLPGIVASHKLPLNRRRWARLRLVSRCDLDVDHHPHHTKSKHVGQFQRCVGPSCRVPCPLVDLSLELSMQGSRRCHGGAWQSSPSVRCSSLARRAFPCFLCPSKETGFTGRRRIAHELREKNGDKKILPRGWGPPAPPLEQKRLAISALKTTIGFLVHQ